MVARKKRQKKARIRPEIDGKTSFLKFLEFLNLTYLTVKTVLIRIVTYSVQPKSLEPPTLTSVHFHRHFSEVVMKFKCSALISGLVIASLCLVYSSDADAGIINTSYETGLVNWTTVGPNSSVINGSINGFNATDGIYYASMNTGTGALPTLVQDFILTNAGLPAGYIASVDPGAVEGATLFQAFTLNAGYTSVEFDWNFLTNENPGSITFDDFAFALLYNNTSSSIAGTALLDTNSVLFAGGPQFSRHTGWVSVAMGGLTAGNSYTMVFGVFDRGNSGVDSGLLVDNVRAVPEPSAVLSVVLAGVLATGIRRRLLI